ncbi:MAG: DNA ligase [Gemmataceae bacterium]
MRDLRDGESLEVQGSNSRPYVLKNVGGVYSCSCPAWRNQSLPIERRTCKHLRQMRGDQAEHKRVGDASSSRMIDAAKPKPTAPPLLLAESWDGEANPAGWWMSEKMDGVRAFWTGTEFLSRLGNRLHAPDWFTAGLPNVALDGELWIARKTFQRTVSVVRRHDQSEDWRQVRFVAFDAPENGATFEKRVETIERIMRTNRPTYARALAQSACIGVDHLRRELAAIEAQGGEGIMLREPGSLYIAGRSPTLLKVKSFYTDEGRVVGHEAGKGRHRGRLGALLLELPNGKKFAVGSGMSDADRSSPPPVGALVTFRFQELTDGGIPRFPIYVRVRSLPILPSTFTGEQYMATQTRQTKARRFEHVIGSSDKFYQIEVVGNDVVVRYGRNGTDGQTLTKSFPDPSSAQRHADKLIAQKLGKGYIEIG